MNARTTVITVTYKSAKVLTPMLASIPTRTPVIVVDNASDDDTVALAEECPGVRLIRNKQNLGFGRACNIGAAASDTEFLLFLNPDACLEKGCIEALESEADQRSDIGAANPLISDSKGRTHLKMSSIIDTPDMPRPQIDQAGEMPVLSGAALFVPRDVFEEVGGFDPSIFLYHEDHDLCHRIRQAGYSLWHLPAARVVHQQGSSSPKVAENAYRKGYEMARSRFYLMEKNRRGDGFRGAFWPALFGFVSPVNLISKRRRAKYRGQIFGALSARKDGGRFTSA